MAEIGVVPIEVKDDNDWGTAAHDDLEECVRVKDIKDDMMKTYLTNTNLLSNRIVSATTSVGSHSHELELADCVEKGRSISYDNIQDIVSTQIYILSSKRYISDG